MHTLLRDVKFAWRSFGQTPGFTAPVVLSLAMGIGANTAIFTLTNAVFLNPLPVEEPSRVLETFTVDHRTVVTGAPLPRGAMSFPNYEDFRDQNEVFSGLTAIQEVLAQGTTIGVYSRMALGARPMDVLRLVIGQSMRLTAVGVGLGIPGAMMGRGLPAACSSTSARTTR